MNVDPEKYVPLEECGVEALNKNFENQVGLPLSRLHRRYECNGNGDLS